jgi:hypothetical protein
MRTFGRAMARTVRVSRRLLTAETRVQPQSSACSTGECYRCTIAPDSSLAIIIGRGNKSLNLTPPKALLCYANVSAMHNWLLVIVRY